MRELIVGDVGGTHARFAIAEVTDGRVVRLGQPVTLSTVASDGLAGTWRVLAERLGRPLPRAAALAAASPNGAAGGKLTRDIWTLPPADIDAMLGTDTHLVLNDFGAVAHAVQHSPADQLAHLRGPEMPLPETGVITVCGPGTGIGCAQLIRAEDGYRIVEAEGGHIGFAPTDAFEDALLAGQRGVHGRVSAERLCGGPGIVPIYRELARAEGLATAVGGGAIWAGALDGSDRLAVAALERFLQMLGGLAGDLALAHGAGAVVIAGGLGLRIRDRLAHSGFGERFVAKGRFRERMGAIPVKLITHPQPGLFGAAAAFAARFG